MPTIDSDAHVVETEQTWEYMEPSDRKYKPLVVAPTNGDGTKYWMIDGKIRGRARGPVAAQGLSAKVGRRMDVPEAARHMEDIPGRLRHMDELGIDTQVLYPTIYLGKVCDRPETEIAMTKSYNRWLTDIWGQSKGRLRYACVLPLDTMDEALKELRFCAQHGACAVFMRGVEGDRLLVNPYFFPLYEEASRLNIPMGVHIANSNPIMDEVLSKDGIGGTFARLRLMSVAAFHALVTSGVPKGFPNLRWVFVEASSQWLPYVIKDLTRRLESRGRELEPNVLEAYNFWVSCQTDDDLSYILKYADENHLVIGTDYGHQDQSSEIEAFRNLRQKEEVDPRVFDKILYDNPKALYNL